MPALRDGDGVELFESGAILAYLADAGFAGWLERYVDESVSPENVLLVAVSELRRPRVCPPCGPTA